MADIDTVLCFDRDHTISVNPHPDRDAVPLSWVKYWAHHDDSVDVWATGNQHLKREAAIPGMKEAKAIWNQQFEAGIEEAFRSESPVTYKPSRRNGLRLIKEIYEAEPSVDVDELTFVVVDDVVLIDLRSEGWIHFTPWEFVELIERGAENFPVTIPTWIEPNNEPAQSNGCDGDYEPHTVVEWADGDWNDD